MHQFLLLLQKSIENSVCFKIGPLTVLNLNLSEKQANVMWPTCRGLNKSGGDAVNLFINQSQSTKHEHSRTATRERFALNKPNEKAVNTPRLHYWFPALKMDQQEQKDHIVPGFNWQPEKWKARQTSSNCANIVVMLCKSLKHPQ